MRLTILSPHRDDAAFSLCIALARWSNLPIEIDVFNIFTCSGYAPQIESNDPLIVSAIRREEDRSVVRQIHSQIEVHEEDLLDAPLRTGLKVDQLCNPQNAGLIEEELLQALEQAFISCRSELVMAPLSLGDHIDHVAVCQAALRAFPTQRLGFYEDLPYAMWTPEEVLRHKINAAARARQQELYSVHIREPIAARAKAQTIAGYKSQITIAEAKLMADWSGQFGGGERIWVPARAAEWKLLTG